MKPTTCFSAPALPRSTRVLSFCFGCAVIFVAAQPSALAALQPIEYWIADPIDFTANDYVDNMDLMWASFTAPDPSAVYIKVQFSFIDFENDFDSVSGYDKTGIEYLRLTGSLGSVTSEPCRGNYVAIYIHTDSSQCGYDAYGNLLYHGFSITGYYYGVIPPNRHPVALALAWPPETVEAGQMVYFNGSLSWDPDLGDSISAYLWDFGDGTTSTLGDPAHAYGAPGQYRASLTVWDTNIGSNTDFVNISVRGADLYVASNGTNAGLVCTNPAAPCASIAYAIGQARTGATIHIKAGVYTEAGITLDKDVTLLGDGATNTVVQAAATSGAATNRVFLVQSNMVATIQDLTVRYGLSQTGGVYSVIIPGGGGILNSGTLMLNNVEVTTNGTAKGQDGWMFSFGNGAPAAPGGAGGGIYNEGTLTLSNCTVSGNFSGDGGDFYWGPGPWNAEPGPGGEGGGIFNAGHLILRSSTISGNTTGREGYTYGLETPQRSYGFGGGICSSGSLAISNSTVAANAGARGGGICSFGLLTARLTILGGNTDDGYQPAGQDLTGELASGGFNLIQDTNGWANTGSTNGNILGLSPCLAPLRYNDGPTRTHALVVGSPAIDAGDPGFTPPPSTDQRGQPRVQGGCVDIGAFEYGSVMPTIAVSRSGTTGLSIVGRGNAGGSCRLLSSPDLSSWVPLATNKIGSDGTVLFYDTYAPGGVCRFYRLVMP